MDSGMKFHIPAKGKIASMYGWRTQRNNIGIKERKFHRGADIAGKYGEDIYASESGIVIFVGWNGGYGRYVEIKHNNRYSTCYCHLKKYTVAKGDTVIAGEKIGEMGNSGTTFSTIGGKGVHLHFEIRDKTKVKWNNPKGTVNPLRNLKNYHSISKYDIVEFLYTPEKLVSVKPQKLPLQIIEKPVLISDSETIYGNKLDIVCKYEEYSPVAINTKKAIVMSGIRTKIRLQKRSVNYINTFRTIENKKEEESKTFYSIQIAANNTKLSDEQINLLEKKYNISGILWSRAEINGKIWYKYTIGFFDNMEEAMIYKNKLYKNNNVKKAAICFYKNDRIIKTYW